MNVLITGASGFVAPYLIRELAAHGHACQLSSRSRTFLDVDGKFHPVMACDLTDPSEAERLVRETNPDAVVHLSAISSVGQAWGRPDELVEANVVTTNSLCRALARSNKKTTFLFVSSAMVYSSGEGKTLAEDDAVGPVVPYGMSKLSAEYVVKSYASDAFKPYIVRPFNHIGPGQSSKFVCAVLAERVANAPDQGEISVGNIGARRDFSDVRDMVRAYRLILEKRPAETLFVLGSGRTVTIDEILRAFIGFSGKRLCVAVDPGLFRPTDPGAIVSNPALARSVLGWRCEIPLERTLREMHEAAARRFLDAIRPNR